MPSVASSGEGLRQRLLGFGRTYVVPYFPAAALFLLCLGAFWAFIVDPLTYKPPKSEVQSLRRMIVHLAFDDMLFAGSERYKSIMLGKPVQVLFDACPVEDEGWDPENDYLGTIICNTSYSITYSAAKRSWAATGKNEATGAILTSEAAVGDPGLRQFSIWGVLFKFDDEGSVYVMDGTRVGRIVA